MSREFKSRICMRCRKGFMPRYEHNWICNNCQRINDRVASIPICGRGPIRRGVTPGGKD